MTAEQEGIFISLTGEERKALDELAQKQELSPERVMRQALRLYQMVTLGHAEVVIKDIGPPKFKPLGEDA